MNRLAGQVAIVTGAGRGIGRSVAGALAREGAKVYLAARTKSDLDKAAKELRDAGCVAEAIPTDITSAAQVSALVDEVVARESRVDILVNNAGIGIFKPVREMDVAELDAMWDVNMRGVFMATRAVLPTMVNRRGGAIVNIGSLAGKNFIKNGAGYCATKWALRGFASSLMLEVREFNIRVITVFPGSVSTGFSIANEQGRNIIQPGDIADAVVFAVTLPERSMVSEIDVRPTNP